MEEVDREETQEVMEAQGVPEDESVQEPGDNDEVNNCDDQQTEENGDSSSPRADSDEPSKPKSELKERSAGGKKGNRFQPYSKDRASAFAEKRGRNRVFISNIPYDMKWQAIKDLMRDKVGEVTYVELFKDAEGKSRGCGVVEFKDAEFVKKAVEAMASQDLNGRPLNIREDFDGDHARRALNRSLATFSTTHGDRTVPLNIPPSIVNNPNIPPEILNSLQAGRLGSTVFVANLDFKVGWKKLKEVFGMAGTVKRADIKEDQDGKSRGMGTVTFDTAIEAVQAISMFNGQLLFDRVMHVKMDDKSIPQDEFRSSESKTPQLPRGLGGIGMGLGPGGQPLSAHMSVSGGMGNMGPAGMGGPGFGGMNRMGAGVGGFGGMDGMSNMGGFGVNRMSGVSGVDDFRGNMGIGMSGGMANSMGGMGGMASRLGDLYRAGMGNMDRDFTRDMAMNRSFGDSFGGMAGAMVGGFGGMAPTGMGPVGSGMSGGMGTMNNMAVGLGMDRMGSTFDRMGAGLGMDRAFGGFGANQTGSGKRIYTKGCQIFVRNLPFDLVWQKLKEKFNQCGHVMYAEVKMENGKSKGCGTVRFDTPETAEKACRLMNGSKINGREIDVRMDRNA